MLQIWTKSTLLVSKLYSKWPPLARTHARCLLRHWSIIASSKNNCSSPHAPDIDDPPFQFIHPHTVFVCGRHDAAWQPGSRNPHDWDLGCLKTTVQVWCKKVWRFLTQQFNCCTHARARRGVSALSCWNIKLLPDTLRIIGSSMTLSWHREAALKKSERDITRISCFATRKLPHALQVYFPGFAKKCMRWNYFKAVQQRTIDEVAHSLMCLWANNLWLLQWKNY